MRTVLGIDQGGSKTYAVITDDTGRILGTGRGPGACHSDAGMARAMAAVAEAAGQACAEAGIAPGTVTAAAGGLTGVDWPDEADLVRKALADTLLIPAERIQVVNDCLIALRAATSSPAGCILCAGTGLNCAVRDGRGREYTFGFYIREKDQGGMALARRVLQAVYDAESGMGPTTALSDRALALAGCGTVDDLLRMQVTGKLPGGIMQQLPLMLEETALKGDEVSLELLRSFGRDTAAYAVAALRRFHMENSAVRVVLSGSVFKCRAAALLDTVRASILSSVPRAVLTESTWEPVIGAVLLALDHLEGTDAAVIQQHIKRDAQRFNMVRKTN